MSNPFQIQFTLRQHTPIIHFQHHQDGATLRATEVKPKLDRFLIEQMGNGNYDAGVFYAKEQNWFIGEGKNGHALDYKMRIIASDKPTPEEIRKGEQFPCFFANMGDEYADSPKKFVFHKIDLKLQITCFHTDLKLYLEKHLNSFMSQTNFGMRQSKGFGSFSILNQKVEGATAFFTVNGDKQNNCKALFKAIDMFYKSIRGGVRNYDGGPPCKFYFKSLLVTYYHQNAPTPTPLWDKKAIKQVLLNRGASASNVDIKDLVGLSSTETWGRQTINKKDELSDALVNRFASPIVFKPIYDDVKRKWTIYLFHKPIPDIYKGTTIVATLDSRSVKLKMWDDFDLKAFLLFIEKYNDEAVFEQHIEDYDRDGNLDAFLKHPDCSNLKTLFSTYQTL